MLTTPEVEAIEYAKTLDDVLVSEGINIEEANGVIVITINNNLIPNLGVGRNSKCPGEELGIAMDIAMSIINAIYPDAQP